MPNKTISHTHLVAVIERVAHRGPDGSGWQEFDTPVGPLTFAHRRLAIFDTTENGHQPMSLQGRPLWIVYNGAIYNFIEIRKELEAKGVTFRSNSDTEVLLSAYAAWGPDCLDRLNGMFAFVIWDGEKKCRSNGPGFCPSARSRSPRQDGYEKLFYLA